MSELTLLHESVVDEAEIDSLGHMNVRFYISRADQANRSLLAKLGIEEDGQRIVRRLDTYSRFLREQFAGAPLTTSGGLIVDEAIDGMNGLKSYFEIRNPESGDIAASFIFTSTLIERDSQEPLATPAAPELVDSPYRIRVPEYGLPRSLSLAAPRKVDMAAVDNEVGDDPTPGMMSGRREAVVHPEDCDAKGRLRENVDLMFVLHRPMPGEDLKQMGPPLMRDAQGRRYSWAMMETRSVVWRRPNANDRILSIGADVANGDKWRQSRRWMFNKQTGELLGISDSLGLCIDLDARKAIPMPDDVRAAVEKNAVPHLA